MPDVLEIPSISREFLFLPITGPGDLSSLPIEVAITTGGAPAEDDWMEAVWDEGEARLLIGPGGGDIVLQPTTQYTPWVRITGSPERPVRKAPPFRTI